MTILCDWLLKACDLLGLDADINFKVVVGNGRTLHAIVRIRSIGAENGMLIFGSFDEVSPYVDELLRAGYGFTVLSEPYVGEQFDLDSYRNLFRDWGWSGSD